MIFKMYSEPVVFPQIWIVVFSSQNIKILVDFKCYTVYVWNNCGSVKKTPKYVCFNNTLVRLHIVICNIIFNNLNKTVKDLKKKKKY